jgi:hypothetical protein
MSPICFIILLDYNSIAFPSVICLCCWLPVHISDNISFFFISSGCRCTFQRVGRKETILWTNGQYHFIYRILRWNMMAFYVITHTISFSKEVVWLLSIHLKPAFNMAVDLIRSLNQNYYRCFVFKPRLCLNYF